MKRNEGISKTNVIDTLPETNIAGWKIHHFDDIYQERWGFSWAMLVSGKVDILTCPLKSDHLKGSVM